MELVSIEQTAIQQMERTRRAVWISLLLALIVGAMLVAWAILGPRLGDRAQLIFGLLVAVEATMTGFALAIYSRHTYAMAVEDYLKQLHDLALRLQEASVHDSLTGLYNHGYLLSRLQEEISRANRHGHPLSLVILDLDDFKEVNDRHGHLTGDRTLQYIATAIEREVRKHDVVARYGGDEFCLLLPGTDHSGARSLVTKLRSSVDSMWASPNAPPGGAVSFGCGIATYPLDGGTAHAMIATADAELYQEKGQERLKRAQASDALVQDLFHRMGEVMARTPEPEARLHGLAEAVCASLSARCAVLYWHEDDRPTEIARHFSDPDLEARIMKVLGRAPARADELLSKQAIEQDRVITVRALMPENGTPERFAERLPPGLWSQWTPISIDGYPPAVLLLIGMAEETSPPNPGLARTLARLLGGATQSCLTQETAQRQHIHLEALATMGSVLLTSEPLEERLHKVAQRVVDAAGTDSITIITRDPNSEQSILTSTYTKRNEDLAAEWERHARGQPHFLHQLRKATAALREPIVIDEPAEHPAILPFLQGVYRRGHIHSLLILPLLIDDESLGALAAVSSQRKAFDDDTIAMFRTIAGQIASSTHVALLMHQVRNSYAQLRQSHIDGMLSLAAVAEARDPLTGGHLHRLQAYTEAIARRLGVRDDEVAMLGHAAVIHDIGKLRIPDAIIAKQGPLTEDEWALMRRHPAFGEEVLGENGTFNEARQIVRAHHERWDGTGYPDGLAGEEIPFGALIVSVADVFDALVSQRPYKEAWPIDRAIAYIHEQAGKQFAPQVVAAFLALVEDGTLASIVDHAEYEPPMIDPAMDERLIA